MKVSLNGDLIDYKTEKEIIEEELIECKDLEDLIKKINT